MLLAKWLLCGLLGEVSILVQPSEDRLRDLRVLVGRSAPKVVEANLEPVVHFLMDLVVFGAKLLGSQFLLQRLGLRRGAILVRPANVKRLPSASLMISEKVSLAPREQEVCSEDQPCKDVCAQNRADNVTEMGNVVDIGQSTCDKHISLALFGQNLLI